MLAPPASFATSRRRSAPSAVRRSIRNGTAVSGNLAGLLASRARLLEGSSTWAMAPARASGSCSMIATQDPSPSVTITPSARATAHSATLTIVTRRAAARIRPRRGAGALETGAVDVGRVHARPLEQRLLPALPRRFRQGDRDRIRLLPRGAPRRPGADVPRALGPQRREAGRQRLPRLQIAEKLRDVDGQRVEQQVVLVRVGVEHLAVLVVSVDPPRAHPDRDAPPETAVLVGAARQATRPRDLLGERLKGALVRLRRHDNALKVSRLALTRSTRSTSSSRPIWTPCARCRPAPTSRQRAQGVQIGLHELVLRVA